MVSDVIQVIDENGNAVNSYSYDEWGNILTAQEQINNPMKYAGEYFDDETGLYYLRARYYDSSIGRFISKDSQEGDVKNPLTMNLYTYCGNNPINRWDPTGHDMIYANQYNSKINLDAYVNGFITEAESWEAISDALNWYAANGAYTSIAQYNLGDGNDYNGFDNIILGWTNYWNETLGSGIINPDVVKAMIIQESTVGHNPLNNGLKDVMQSLDPRNPAISRLAARGKYSKYEGLKQGIPAGGYGLAQRLFAGGKYDASRATSTMSICLGIRWLAYKTTVTEDVNKTRGGVHDYNGGGDSGYVGKVVGILGAMMSIAASLFK